MMFNYIIAGVYGAWDFGLSGAYLHAPDVKAFERDEMTRGDSSAFDELAFLKEGKFAYEKSLSPT